jgi:hypothetical protein
MKITPMAQGGQTLGSVDLGRTADPIKMERARAIARGEAPAEPTATQTEQPRPNTRSIRMRTQMSPDRQEAIQEAVEETQSSTPESVEQGAVEATQPLSPQFAALAKQKRALQLERAQLDKDKAELSARGTTDDSSALIAKLKSSPLSVLQEHGVTYDQLTEQLLSGGGTDPRILELEAKLQALESGMEKKLVDRDAATETAALNEMRKEADRLAKDGDSFELVRETNSVPQAIELIRRTYKETGEILDVQDALQAVEDELIEESLKLARLNKVQGRLAPQELPLQQQPQRQMRTLTARDSSQAPMSARARALAAFNGTLRNK